MTENIAGVFQSLNGIYLVLLMVLCENLSNYYTFALNQPVPLFEKAIS